MHLGFAQLLKMLAECKKQGFGSKRISNITLPLYVTLHWVMLRVG
jgi:hypothetical protein